MESWKGEFNMGRFDDMINGLQQEVEIPERVLKKYTDTLAKLPEQKAGDSIHVFSKRRMWPVAAAMALVISTVSISAAAHIQWSKGLEQKFHVTPKQRLELEEIKMASFLGQSVTQGDVTVTVQQSIVDNYYAHLSFKVQGYKLEDGMEPGFGDISIDVGNGSEADGGWSASFYDRTVREANGAMLRPDGTPLGEGSRGYYIMEDGSMEFQVVVMSSEKGNLIGKPIHVELKDLGVYKEKAGDIEVGAQGTWSFDWTLDGSDAVKQYQLNTSLEGSNATVLEAELSPISMFVTYTFPRQKMAETGIDENGQEIICTTYQEPPAFTGVQMKDGTIYTGISNGVMAGYVDNDSDTYECKIALSQVIDVDQVESLLFIKSYPEGEQPLTEENLYFVPVVTKN